jgi:hypothetical protein
VFPPHLYDSNWASAFFGKVLWSLAFSSSIFINEKFAIVFLHVMTAISIGCVFSRFFWSWILRGAFFQRTGNNGYVAPMHDYALRQPFSDNAIAPARLSWPLCTEGAASARPA